MVARDDADDAPKGLSSPMNRPTSVTAQVRIEPPVHPGHPPCLVLPAAADGPPRDPVRIFLGTEDRQARALRVFLYAIEQHRDRAREYRIYLMKDLPGFDRRGWRTGFTLYRFAIPEFAGGTGRAIYNDVDQIYTADPALLFDQPMGSHGYLAVSADDTSVMLMDCARMLPHWHLQAARAGSKRALGAAATGAGLWGPLDGGWNARDLEYVEGRSRLLHYTALHLQPWMPEPERYSYQSHPLGEVWWRAERAADAAGYQPFTAERPSPWFAAACRALAATPTTGASPPADLPDVRSLLWCTPGPAGDQRPPLRTDTLMHWSAADGAPPAAAASVDAVAVSGVLERLPAEDVPWWLERCCTLAQRLLHVVIEPPPGGDSPPPGGDSPPPWRDEHWWRQALRRAVAAHPNLAWHLDIRGTDAIARVRSEPRATFTAAAAPPRVWVLTGPRHGDAEQVRTLAQALGWPWEEKRLRYNALHHLPNLLLGASVASIDAAHGDGLAAPWPDVIIGCGKRSVPVARWVQEQSGGRTRLVFLGRPWAPLSWFDLVVTTPQYGLPVRHNVYVNALPLNRPTITRPEADLDAWRQRLAALPKPWLGLLVGGAARPHRLDAAAARALARQAADLARRRGGSLLITTSPRTGRAAVEALFDGVDVPAYRHRWERDDGGNPLPAYLSLCDEFVVTADSASMLADAVSTGRPVTLAPLPQRWLQARRLGRRLGDLLLGQQRLSHRGTPKQQNGRQRLYDRLVELGLVQTLRDVERLQAPLLQRGVITLLDAAADPNAGRPAAAVALPDELEITASRIRERLGERRWQEPTGRPPGDRTPGTALRSLRAPSR
ncbi:MAG: ELM1/GtrOC1 family putative glycosyltransferase [Pseudomonadales bacterium]